MNKILWAYSSQAGGSVRIMRSELPGNTPHKEEGIFYCLHFFDDKELAGDDLLGAVVE